MSSAIESARVREIALHQAAHDCRGSNKADEVVERAKVYEAYLSSPVRATEADVKRMVNRFLSWKLPANFSPDNGISFQPTSTVPPSGTNLLDATQAEAMVRYMLEFQ